MGQILAWHPPDEQVCHDRLLPPQKSLAQIKIMQIVQQQKSDKICLEEIPKFKLRTAHCTTDVHNLESKWRFTPMYWFFISPYFPDGTHISSICQQKGMRNYQLFGASPELQASLSSLAWLVSLRQKPEMTMGPPVFSEKNINKTDFF